MLPPFETLRFAPLLRVRWCGSDGQGKRLKGNHSQALSAAKDLTPAPQPRQMFVWSAGTPVGNVAAPSPCRHSISSIPSPKQVMESDPSA